MKKLTQENLDDLAIGCAILGSGGGGNPSYTYMMAKHAMEKEGAVSLISLAELDDKEFVVPLGIIGAPLVLVEKMLSGREFLALFEILEETFEKKITTIMPFEIGGASAFIPIIVAAQFGIPVLDADMMGRAFPEAHMGSCYLTKPPTNAFLADCAGNITTISSKKLHMLERISHHITIAMGSSAIIADYPLSGREALSNTIPKSISKAISIGKVQREAKKSGRNSLKAILEFTKGVHIGSGKIIDIDLDLSRGILQGSVTIHAEQEIIEIAFQNEYLVAKLNGKTVATTPDILMLLEQDTGTPITCELLHFGSSVNIIALPAPAIWKTPAGLNLVGPRYFGYDLDYQPINKKLHPQKHFE